MARAYSYDLRRKVIEAIELDGMKRSEASEFFNISRNTINTWFQRRRETVSLLSMQNWATFAARGFD
jgi:transposase